MPLDRISELFDAAIEIEDEDDRASFLKAQCDDAPGLFKEISELVRCHFHGHELLESPTNVLKLVDSEPHSAQEDEGETVGNYKLLQKIGEGGMGVVFMAEQLRPIRRKVAFKIIREGMHSKQILARFEAEREALARLDHPNVTRILDSGATDSGRPYFVMELVRGTTITEYCNAHRVPIEQRIALLEQVCCVMHHAHQKGIVHRDVKPSNIMITLHDGVPVPKVIDFGIAKALDRPLTEQTLFTRYGDLVGTPEYMSPEQAEMSGLDLDVRTDIYSMGVLLYELLTGSTPITSAQIQGKGLLKIFETIRDSETESPSARVNRTLESIPGIAEQRQSNAVQLKRTISGELDWITMKAIAKDRNERYESAAAMAKDLRRFLQGEPVEAAAPSFSYHARKFYSKHRTACLVALACTAILMSSTALSTYWAILSYSNQQIALQHSQELAKNSKALEEAKERAESALDRALAAEKKAEQMARREKLRAVTSSAGLKHVGELFRLSLGNSNASSTEDGRTMASDNRPSIGVTIRSSEQDPSDWGPPTALITSSAKIYTTETKLPDLPEELRKSVPSIVPQSILIDGLKNNTAIARFIRVDANNQLPDRLQEIILEELRKEFGNTDPFVAQWLKQLAESLLRKETNESYIRAENYLREAISILELSPEVEVDRLEAKLLFAKVLGIQGKSLQSESVYAEVRELLGKQWEKTVDEDSRRRLQAMEMQLREM
jgi:serine/threonine protein kinase